MLVLSYHILMIIIIMIAMMIILEEGVRTAVVTASGFSLQTRLDTPPGRTANIILIVIIIVMAMLADWKVLLRGCFGKYTLID